MSKAPYPQRLTFDEMVQWVVAKAKVEEDVARAFVKEEIAARRALIEGRFSLDKPEKERGYTVHLREKP